jgi:predicted neutral ceramidase superfamily lipid hydrolase
MKAILSSIIIILATNQLISLLDYDVNNGSLIIRYAFTDLPYGVILFATIILACSIMYKEIKKVFKNSARKKEYTFLEANF